MYRRKVSAKTTSDSLARVALAPASQEIDLLELDEALTKLARLHERQARVVELRFFSGLSVEETAHALEVASRTVEDDWAIARAWLRRELGFES